MNAGAFHTPLPILTNCLIGLTCNTHIKYFLQCITFDAGFTETTGTGSAIGVDVLTELGLTAFKPHNKIPFNAALTNILRRAKVTVRVNTWALHTRCGIMGKDLIFCAESAGGRAFQRIVLLTSGACTLLGTKVTIRVDGCTWHTSISKGV
jgi:hypothetical protein